MTPADSLRELFAAARTVGREVLRVHVSHVRVLGEGGRVLFESVVPLEPSPTASVLLPQPAPGWNVTDDEARYDGKPVKVSRPRLLRALVEAKKPLSVDELVPAVGGCVENVRFHVRRLVAELAKAFPDFEGAAVEGECEGYRLMLR